MKKDRVLQERYLEFVDKGLVKSVINPDQNNSFDTPGGTSGFVRKPL